MALVVATAGALDVGFASAGAAAALAAVFEAAAIGGLAGEEVDQAPVPPAGRHLVGPAGSLLLLGRLLSRWQLLRLLLGGLAPLVEQGLRVHGRRKGSEIFLVVLHRQRSDLLIISGAAAAEVIHLGRGLICNCLH